MVDPLLNSASLLPLCLQKSMHFSTCFTSFFVPSLSAVTIPLPQVSPAKLRDICGNNPTYYKYFTLLEPSPRHLLTGQSFLRPPVPT